MTENGTPKLDPAGLGETTDDYIPGRRPLGERLSASAPVRGVTGWAGKVPQWVWALIFAGLVIGYPLMVQNAYWVRIGGTVALYIILGVGLNIVAGYSGLLDMGYTAFYGMGAYTYALLASPQFDIHLSFWLILPISMVAAIGLGVLIGSPTLRVRGDYLAIVTLSLGNIFQILLKNMDRPVNITNGPNGIVLVDPPSFFGFVFRTQPQYFYLIVFFAVVVVVAISRLRFSRAGRAWAGIRDDEITASCMGVWRPYYKVLAYISGAALAGLAGAIFASWQKAVFPENFGMAELIAIYCMVVIGGAGSPKGVVLGSISLVFLGEVLRPYGVYRMIIYALLLLLMMRFRPAGILREKPRKSKSTVDEAIAAGGLALAGAGAGGGSGGNPRMMNASATATERRPTGKDRTTSSMTSAPAEVEDGQILLDVQGLSKAFGGVVAVSDVSFHVKKGEILGVIGPNGAGKTTVFNLITGIYKPDAGQVVFKGRDITGLRSDQVAGVGLGRTFQNIRTFNLLSVLDNVMAGAHPRLKGGVWAGIIRPPGIMREEKKAELKAIRHLSFFNRPLAERKDEFVTSLNYADRRRVEISRAMMLDPQILLLDEPAAGMNPTEVEEITAQIKQLRDEGFTIILVEHQMPVVMGVSDRILVMNKGEVLTEGTPAEIQANEDVIKAYLGVQHEECVITEPKRESLTKGEPLLSLKGVGAGYGAVRVLSGVDLQVYPGEIVCLLGANAAGKSTTIKTILGNVRATAGTISFQGEEIQKATTVSIVKSGIGVVPEGRRIFWRLTVEENLEMGAFSSSNDTELIKRGKERAFEQFPILRERRTQKGGTLSGGEQQMLAIARALMNEPKLLLMDEPSMGLSPVLVQQIMDIVVQINEEWGTTIFMVEQNANEALKIADRGYVLQNGRIVITDLACNLLADDAMKAAYLGG